MLPTRAFIGVDVGSASVRAGIYDAQGHRLGFAVRPLAQFRPRANFVEQSTADIWAGTCAAVREALAASKLGAEAIAAIGFDATCSLVATGTAGTPLSVAEDGDPARDVIMWMDHRAVAEAAAINATRDPALAYVGGEVSVEMELPKVLWLARHWPGRYAAAERYFDLADYLVWRCSGVDAASVCTLTCKWNYLAHEQRFPQAMLRAVGLGDLLGKLPRSVLPLCSSPGALRPAAAAELGLHAGVVVATGIIDAHAGGLALAGAQPAGTLALIGGTSNCHMVVSADPIQVPGVWGPYYGAMLPGLWLNEGGQSAAGSLLDWTLHQSAVWPALQETARREDRNAYAVLNARVAALCEREPKPTRDLHVLPDHHGNRSPLADPHARGAVIGLTLEDGEDALTRLYLATLQALAYGTRHIVDSMNAAGHRIERIVMCGGGTRNALLLQEHADALGLPIHLVEDDDAVTLGAALLAATACGAFADVTAAAAAMVRTGAQVAPTPGQAAFHEAKYAVFRRMHDDHRQYREAMAPIH